MQVRAMNRSTHSARAVAMAARINAAIQDAAAVRACVCDLELRAIMAQLRAERLAARLARIEVHARRALALTRDERARAALGDIAVTAGERDAPAAI